MALTLAELCKQVFLTANAATLNLGKACRPRTFVEYSRTLELA